jgi:maleate isomerase
MPNRVLIGMLTPSSNTVLEPVTSAILSGLSDVSVHFGRFRVTEISLEKSALDQFDPIPMLSAADLLADAKVGVMTWNGTSASWRGFDTDRELCASITERTGIPASSATLALDEIFRLAGIVRFGLVTPYDDDVQAQIVSTYASEGYECIAERHVGIRENFAFAEVSSEALCAMVREVAEANPQAIAILCTNLRGAPLVAALEEETGIPIYDSVAVSVWAALRVGQIRTDRVRGWGSLFQAGL